MTLPKYSFVWYDESYPEDSIVEFRFDTKDQLFIIYNWKELEMDDTDEFIEKYKDMDIEGIMDDLESRGGDGYRIFENYEDE